MQVGTELKIIGRVQSRAYEKKHEDGTIENRMAYEVSVGSLEVAGEGNTTNKAEENAEDENKDAF